MRPRVRVGDTNASFRISRQHIYYTMTATAMTATNGRYVIDLQCYGVNKSETTEAQAYC